MNLAIFTTRTLGVLPRLLRGLHGFLRYPSRFDVALRGILVVFFRIIDVTLQEFLAFSFAFFDVALHGFLAFSFALLTWLYTGFLRFPSHF